MKNIPSTKAIGSPIIVTASMINPIIAPIIRRNPTIVLTIVSFSISFSIAKNSFGKNLIKRIPSISIPSVARIENIVTKAFIPSVKSFSNSVS